MILDDLRRTCRPEQSPLVFTNLNAVDVERTMVSLGHREVWLQVLHRMGLVYEDLLESLMAAKKEESR